MGLDPSEYTVEELKSELAAVDDEEELEATLEAERDGKDRKTAREAIERRLRAVRDAGGDGGDAGDEAGGDGEGRSDAGDAADGDGPEAGTDDAPEAGDLPLDPAEYDVSELGPAIQEVEDIEDLRAILAAEEAGEDRVPVKTLVESRIEKFTEEEGSDDDLDLAEMSVADVANEIRGLDDVDRLEELLEREEGGKDRDAVKTQIQNRIDSVAESDEQREAQLPPEEKHPELDHPTADKRHVRAVEDGTYRDMWVYCETQAGELVDVTKEMLGKARELMDDYNDRYDADERVVAVLVGDDVERHVEDVVAYGADVVLYFEDERLDRFRHTAYTEVFCDMARAADHPYGRAGKEPADWRDYDEPRYVLFPATNNGRDLSAMVQAELDSGLASDCSGLYIENEVISNPAKTGEPGSKRTFERVLHMKRPDFSGFEYSTILCLDNPEREFHPQGASVIPGSFDVPDPDPEREAETVVDYDLPVEAEWLRVEVTEFDRLEGGVDLTGHDVIVCLGRGISDDPTRGMELGVELAEAFEDADVGVTRGIVTGSFNFDGHVEQYTREERQIGETGQVVEPDLYIAAGVSGAVQHKVGMDESDTIVAVNTDPEARIRDFCDYFIEGDLFEVLPRLVEAVETGGEVDAVADGGRPSSGRGGDDDE